MSHTSSANGPICHVRASSANGPCATSVPRTRPSTCLGICNHAPVLMPAPLCPYVLVKPRDLAGPRAVTNIIRTAREPPVAARPALLLRSTATARVGNWVPAAAVPRPSSRQDPQAGIVSSPLEHNHKSSLTPSLLSTARPPRSARSATRRSRITSAARRSPIRRRSPASTYSGLRRSPTLRRRRCPLRALFPLASAPPAAPSPRRASAGSGLRRSPHLPAARSPFSPLRSISQFSTMASPTILRSYRLCSRSV
ncbi:hypothetical protein PVAP13_3KG393505 [Panicum virgatum]|uniref:Uncharacterized protein n=1 Tax=Panicum virgatum TaxID=38727 RepID=A0A8T0V4I6_PANVG|nr:hypothetical protein PVAP13_3KG393505 [Panicum virgatum]